MKTQTKKGERRGLHDWRGAGEKMFYGNAWCGWVMLRRGIDGDGRIRYQDGKNGKPILKPHPCRGTR